MTSGLVVFLSQACCLLSVLGVAVGSLTNTDDQPVGGSYSVEGAGPFVPLSPTDVKIVSIINANFSVFDVSHGSVNKSRAKSNSSKPRTSVPYDEMSSRNPIWTAFLEEVAKQTSRNLADLRTIGANDPEILSMWEGYVQSLGDGAPLPMSGIRADMGMSGSMGGDPGMTMSGGIPLEAGRGGGARRGNSRWFEAFFRKGSSGSQSPGTENSSQSSLRTSSSRVQTPLTPSNRPYPRYHPALQKYRDALMQQYPSQHQQYPAEQYYHPLQQDQLSPLQNLSQQNPGINKLGQQTQQAQSILTAELLRLLRQRISHQQPDQTVNPGAKLPDMGWDITGTKPHDTTRNITGATQLSPVSSSDARMNETALKLLSDYLGRLTGTAQSSSSSQSASPAAQSVMSPQTLANSQVQPQLQLLPQVGFQTQSQPQPVFQTQPQPQPHIQSQAQIQSQHLSQFQVLNDGPSPPVLTETSLHSVGQSRFRISDYLGSVPAAGYQGRQESGMIPQRPSVPSVGKNLPNSGLSFGANQNLGCQTMTEMEIEGFVDCNSVCPDLLPGSVSGGLVHSMCICCPFQMPSQPIV